MKHTFISLAERPAFMKIVDLEQQEICDGYILQIDIQNNSASIIKLKKGGKVSMKKTIVKALEGFEKQFDDLNEMKANIQNEIEIAKADAIAEVEARFAVKVQRIDKVLEDVSVTEEIEVAEEEKQDAEIDTPVQSDAEIVNENEIL